MASFSLWEEAHVSQGQLPAYYEILYVAIGLTFLRIPHVLAAYASTFLMAALFYQPGGLPFGDADKLIALSIATLLGLGCFSLRRRLLKEQFTLQQLDDTRQRELREALHEDQLQREKLQLQQAAHLTDINASKAILENLQQQQSSLKQELMHCQAMDSIGRLAGGLAHELNNTLTVVSGLLELNQDHLKELPDGEELVAELKETLSRGGELAGRLVSVSGNMALHKRPVEISQLLRTLKKIVGSHRQDRFKLEVPDEVLDLTVMVDEGAWLQTLSNLLVNAWDASPADSTVELSIEVQDGIAQFRVSDRGKGIPLEYQDKIFEPYFTTKARGSGTGLGLAIAAGVAEKLGGSLVLEKSDKRGTVFCASVPLAKESLETLEEEAPVSVIDRKVGAKVLFVEDEEAILKVAKRHLARLGFEVTATTQPSEALNLLNNERYDVVVSDVVMPGLDGPGLIKQARQTVPDLKVIFVSGYTDDRLRGTGMSQAGQAFLRKPYTIPDLASLIDKTIRD